MIVKIYTNTKGMNTLKDWLEVHKIKIVAVIIILIFCFYFYFLNLSKENEIIIGEASPPVASEQNGEEPNKNSEEKINIMVDIKGAVMKPGVYHAEHGERVIDLINKAGGFSKEADRNQVNLSEHIEDEMVIFVPIFGEMEEVSAIGIDKQKSALINLNKATESELQTLPGIGPSKALAIIEYRETNGGFKTIDDLKKISGIGEKTYEKLEALISVK